MKKKKIPFLVQICFSSSSFLIFMTVIVLMLGFKYGETAICFTSCQILNFEIHQLNYIVEFEYEKSVINKSLKKKYLKEPLST